jgi:hypothetical protein
LSDKRLHIKALGEWSVKCDGKPVLGGPNLTIVLHALILTRGKVFREDLVALLAEHEQGATHQDRALRNALTKLRAHSLEIPQSQNPVTMSVAQPHASIDLWDFFSHVSFGRYREAHALIAEGQEPYLLPGVEDPEHPVWQSTFAAFREARDETIAAIEAESGRAGSMLTTRERLLGRSLVPGVGRPIPIRDVRGRIGGLQVPWRLERPEGSPPNIPLPEFLVKELSKQTPMPTQAIVVGGVGAGKTLAAISTFLRLTDDLDAGGDGRTVLYVDAEAETSNPEFGSDRWLERQLHEMGADGSGQPIVIIPHGDSFLAAQQNLRRALDTSLFRSHNVLLCCSSQVYSRRLSYEEFGTHVVHLEPWSQALQHKFSLALTGEQRHTQFLKWQEQDPTRVPLCAVPLHLVHVLALLGEESEAITEIATLPQLLEGVAQTRLRVARPPFDEDQIMEDLGSVAHRFYVDATPSDIPIHFTVEELRHHLRSSKRKNVKRRADAMINETLIAVSPGTTQLRFEDPSWARFFTARHIAHTLLYHPRETVAAFSRFLSASMMGICEQMLREKLLRYESEIYESLRLALRRESQARVSPDRLTIAREQVGYLMGVLGNRRVREELAPMVEPGSAQGEDDHLVRRGILIGLAAGGDARFGDIYVDALRAERDAGGSTPERDTNIGFLLSLAGDQEFDPERPGRIGCGAYPVRMVGDLVGRLGEPHYAGVWRVMAFTLTDLRRHPAISDADLGEVLQPHRTELNEVLRRLSVDSRTSRWPELPELRSLLSEHGLLEEETSQASVRSGHAPAGHASRT